MKPEDVEPSPLMKLVMQGERDIQGGRTMSFHEFRGRIRELIAARRRTPL
jgi:hypothetical protein